MDSKWSVFILHVSNDVLVQPCGLQVNLVKEMDKNGEKYQIKKARSVAFI